MANPRTQAWRSPACLWQWVPRCWTAQLAWASRGWIQRQILAGSESVPFLAPLPAWHCREASPTDEYERVGFPLPTSAGMGARERIVYETQRTVIGKEGWTVTCLGSDLIFTTSGLCDRRRVISALWASAFSALNLGDGRWYSSWQGVHVKCPAQCLLRSRLRKFLIGWICRSLRFFSILGWHLSTGPGICLTGSGRCGAGISLPGAFCQMPMWRASLLMKGGRSWGKEVWMEDCGTTCGLTWKDFYWILTPSQALCWCLTTCLIYAHIHVGIESSILRGCFKTQHNIISWNFLGPSKHMRCLSFSEFLEYPIFHVS